MSTALIDLSMRKLEINTVTKVSICDILDAISGDDASDIILAIDLNQQDAEFTEQVIIKLFTSLLADINPDGGKDLANHLKKIAKEHKKKNG